MQYFITQRDRGKVLKLAISTKFSDICQVKPTIVLTFLHKQLSQTNKITLLLLMWILQHLTAGALEFQLLQSRVKCRRPKQGKKKKN
jgi:hypothetical protein